MIELEVKLIEKIEKEMEELIRETKTKPVDEIILSSHELVFKEDFKTIIESRSDQLEIQEIKALLKLDKVLHEVYSSWDSDSAYMSELADSFQDTLNDVVRKDIANIKQRNQQRDSR